MRKPTRTISGVSPIAVMLPPRACRKGACLYCPSLNAPQSYTPESPAVLRASKLNYDAFEQVKARINAFKIMGHPTDKVELIIMGGTFLDYPVDFQYKFVKDCYDALNGKKSKDLAHAKKINEKAKNRCVALCIETRPDVCGDEEIKRILEFGATRVELGVQVLDDKIYGLIKRRHSVQDVVDATKKLKNNGFKVGFHLMPGLPGSSLKKDLKLFQKVFSDEDFRPDQIKIYPTQVLKGAKLEKIYYRGGYEPYKEEELIQLLLNLKLMVPKYCRIMRIMREIPPAFLVAGTKRIDLRKVLLEELERRKKKCNCIRCREIGFVRRDSRKDIDNRIKLKRIDYKASGSKEIFLEFVNKNDVLFGLCRLRIVGSGKSKFMFVRELHVYGKELKLSEKGKEKHSQHIGLGKKLMKEAEKIAKKEKCSEIKVISGIGVREYYSSKLGYKLVEPYMVKKI
ncbi:MAG: tRNA uridine(34) 5-carboxymethylaminomethyl modification radical SAM/GNAT enzyme Elp3 [Nanoarchaeota archaeon]|nr:tRNA uridine(34) 5-carboxymethylaminomethyl modification radical SAM/GNAT enzyme Elp3 [Nanoarchaeota archaeon]